MLRPEFPLRNISEWHIAPRRCIFGLSAQTEVNMAKHHSKITLEEKAVLTILQKEHDVHAFDDMPPGILMAFGGLWAVLVVLFWAAFASDAQSRFAITVATLFIGMYFSVPLLMTRQAKPKLARSSDMVATCTGLISTRAAAIQVVLIPAALILAIGVMALIKISVLAG
jgi:hypothetical protein